MTVLGDMEQGGVEGHEIREPKEVPRWSQNPSQYNDV